MAFNTDRERMNEKVDRLAKKCIVYRNLSFIAT